MSSAKIKPEFVERRGEPRHPVAVPAVVIMDADRQAPCMILNTTSRGAQIGLRNEVRLPPRFSIQLTTPDERIEVRLVWQVGPVAGVQFDTRPTLLERLGIKTWFKLESK